MCRARSQMSFRTFPSFTGGGNTGIVSPRAYQKGWKETMLPDSETVTLFTTFGLCTLLCTLLYETHNSFHMSGKWPEEDVILAIPVTQYCTLNWLTPHTNASRNSFGLDVSETFSPLSVFWPQNPFCHLRCISDRGSKQSFVPPNWSGPLQSHYMNIVFWFFVI